MLVRQGGCVRFGLLTLVVSLIAALPVVAEHPDNGPKSKDPVTIEEGLQRLEAIFGRYDRENQQEWQFLSDREVRSRQTPDAPEILIRIKAVSVMGHPFLHSDGIAIDIVANWKREVFDIEDDGSLAKTRSQLSHSVDRLVLHPTDEGYWLASRLILSNGVHSAIGSPSFQGTVRWHEDGVEFIGISGPGKYYVAGGQMVMGVGHGGQRFVREGDRLVRLDRHQSYHLATDDQGHVLPIPDFKRPLGSFIETRTESEPRIVESESP